MTQSSWDTAKAVVRGKFIAIHSDTVLPKETKSLKQPILTLRVTGKGKANKAQSE